MAGPFAMANYVDCNELYAGPGSPKTVTDKLQWVSVQCRRPCRQWRAEVRPRSVGNTTRWALSARRTREDRLQAGRHGVPQPAQSDTSVPRRPPHSASGVASRLRLCSTSTDNNFSYVAVDSTPTTIGLSALVWNSLWRTQRSGAWFRQF